MSAKIYCGLRSDVLNETVVFSKVMRRLATALNTCIEKLTAQAISVLAIEKFDDAAVKGETLSGVLSLASDEFRTRHKVVQNTARRDPEIDFSFTMTIAHTGKFVLAIPFFENKQLYQTVLNLKHNQKPIFTKYPYWNSIDRPKNVSNSEWQRRSKEWDKFCDMNCVELSCGKDLVSPNIELFDFSILSFEQRVNRIAEDMVLRRFMADAKEPSMEAAVDAFQYIRTEEGKAEVSDISSSQVAPKLKPFLCREDLL